MKNEILLLTVIAVVALVCIVALIAGIVQLCQNRKRYKRAKARANQREDIINDIADELAKLATSKLNVASNITSEAKEDIKKEVFEELGDKCVAPVAQTNLCSNESVDKIVAEIKELTDAIKNNQVVLPTQAVMPVQTISQDSADSEQPVVKEENGVEVAVLTDDSVVFSSKKDMTLTERYDELSKEAKSNFDEIADYAASQENVKVIENNKYKEYKIGNNKVVRLEVKRDTVIASFVFIDADLRKYSRENKIAIKQKAVPVKIVSASDVQLAKDSIDMVIKQIEEDLIAKKEFQKEKRKQKKLEKQGNK